MSRRHIRRARPHALALSLCALLLFNATHAGSPRAQQAAAVVPVSNAKPQTQTPARPQGTNGVDARAADERKTKRVVTGSITGRVVGESGEPVAGISVYTIPRAPRQTFRTPRTATADDDGNFTLRELEPGVYSVGASMPGYVTEADPLTGRANVTYRPGDTATVRLVRGGVVTGTVTDQQGEPLVAMSVRAFRVRDIEGRALPASVYSSSEDKTDDRGVYRIYGLPSGVYYVVAGGASPWAGGFRSPYEADVPTFYPSATRDTAAEVSVRAGQETSGIDVRYRDEQGHRVTGAVEPPSVLAPDSFNSSIGISLYYASSNINAGNTFVQPGASERPFSFEGIADGDYDLQSTGGGRDGLTFTSAPQRITVRGADVTGLRIKLTPLASVSGSLFIEQATGAQRASAVCKDRRASPLPQETLVTLVFDRPAASTSPPARTSPSRDASPDDAGAFTLRSLEAGRYHIAARPLDENLFVSSIQLPALSTGATNKAPASASTANKAAAPRVATANAAAQRAGASSVAATPSARDTLDLKAGQQLAGVAVRLSDGAAGLSGRVGGAEGAPSPPFAQLRVYLLPSEREYADDPLRYFELATSGDGSFNFKNLPPGRYLLLARTSDTNEAAPRPASWDSDSRARLRREAEAANTTVELQPCQRTTDFTLRFPQTPPK